MEANTRDKELSTLNLPVLKRDRTRVIFHIIIKWQLTKPYK